MELIGSISVDINILAHGFEEKHIFRAQKSTYESAYATLTVSIDISMNIMRLYILFYYRRYGFVIISPCQLLNRYNTGFVCTGSLLN